MITIFQNLNLTWYTEAPRFTQCFQNTVLVWVPCTFLWIVMPFYVFYLSRVTDTPTPVTKLNTAKTVRNCSNNLQKTFKTKQLSWFSEWNVSEECCNDVGHWKQSLSCHWYEGSNKYKLLLCPFENFKSSWWIGPITI